MSNDHDRILAQNVPGQSFLAELSQRTALAPIRASNGNEYILVDMHGCSTEFLRGAETFFTHSDRFRLLIRGLEYYAEVLNGESFTEAYRKLAQQ